MSSLPNDFPIGVSDQVRGKRLGSIIHDKRGIKKAWGRRFYVEEKDSIYQAGRVKGAWYKWKIDPFVADMVVVSAQLGHGKRSNL